MVTLPNCYNCRCFIIPLMASRIVSCSVSLRSVATSVERWSRTLIRDVTKMKQHINYIYLHHIVSKSIKNIPLSGFLFFSPFSQLPPLFLHIFHFSSLLIFLTLTYHWYKTVHEFRFSLANHCLLY